MEQPLLLQARQFLLSAALGAALGLHYDLLRGLRRWARWLTHPLDLWFALSVLAANLWFALRIGGGQFRIFALVGSALGAAGYFAGPSRLLLPVFGSFWKLFTAPGRLLARGSKNFFEKTGIFSKNIFSSAKKSVTIKTDTAACGGTIPTAWEESRMRLRKSSLITKLLILAVMIYAIVTVVTLQPQISDSRQQAAALQADVASAQQANLALEQDIANVGTDEAVMKIARERLNLVEDGEMIFIDSDK